MSTSFAKYKQKLEKEKEEIDAILSQIAERSENSDTFNPKVADFGDDVTEFEDEEAGEAEEFSRRIGITDTLAERRRVINDALQRIHDKAFGVCISCGGSIEAKMLDANPASTFCVACKNKEGEAE